MGAGAGAGAEFPDINKHNPMPLEQAKQVMSLHTVLFPQSRAVLAQLVRAAEALIAHEWERDMPGTSTKTLVPFFAYLRMVNASTDPTVYYYTQSFLIILISSGSDECHRAAFCNWVRLCTPPPPPVRMRFGDDGDDDDGPIASDGSIHERKAREMRHAFAVERQALVEQGFRMVSDRMHRIFLSYALGRDFLDVRNPYHASAFVAMCALEVAML